MKIFNDVVNSSMPLRLLVSQSCEGPSFTFFCFNATSRPSQHIRVHPGQQSPQAANWSLLWDHRSWALGELASKILITLKAGVQFLIFLLADRSHQLFNYQINKSAHCTPHTSLSTASKRTYAATIVPCGHLFVLLSQLN